MRYWYDGAMILELRVGILIARTGLGHESEKDITQRNTEKAQRATEGFG
jgi:hypothetical protein